MPTLKLKDDEAPALEAFIGPAVGTAADFWALAYCSDADELERDTNRQHGQFTFILRYQLPHRTLIYVGGTDLFAWDGKKLAQLDEPDDDTPQALALSADDRLIAGCTYVSASTEAGEWERIATPMKNFMEFEGRNIPFIGRAALIKNKRAAGRPKDLADLAWLEAHPEGMDE